MLESGLLVVGVDQGVLVVMSGEVHYRVPDAPDARCQALLGAVEALLDDELRGELSQRLEAWFERKDAETAGSCSPPSVSYETS